MTTVPEPGVVISLRSIYEKLTRVEATTVNTARDVKAVKAAQGDHERRLRELEENRWPWKVIAGLVALGGLVVAIFGLITKN
jgi:hypothetical protein